MTQEWLENYHAKQRRIRAGRMPSIGRRWPDPKKKGPNGKKICKVCGAEGKTAYSPYCSDPCRERAWAYYGWGRMRAYIYKRDGGKCVACGCDLAMLARILEHVLCKYKPALKRELGFNAHCYTLYDTDHIVPVVDGGNYEPENLRTLCTPCHKAETALLARKRAEDKRRAAEPASLFECQ